MQITAAFLYLQQCKNFILGKYATLQQRLYKNKTKKYHFLFCFCVVNTINHSIIHIKLNPSQANGLGLIFKRYN